MGEVVDWRDQILKEFTPKVAHLTLAADPDGLLVEEELLGAIRERGFELITLEDHAAFRFVYESGFRSFLDRGTVTVREVILRIERHDLASLPYDLLQASRQVYFSLGDLFPGLSYPVLASLDRADLEALYRVRMQYGSEKLGDDATKDFALLHIFGIAPALIKQPAELLRVLLRRHYRGQHVPSLLDARLVQELRKGGAFHSWPLENIVPNREAFFAFLQERWPLFLDRASGYDTEDRQDATTDLPFDHDDVRVYIDNLFLEGMLRPVLHKGGDALAGSWAAVGIQADPDADRLRRLQGLMAAVGETIPSSEARHQDWSAFAYRWAELGVLWSGVAAEARSNMSGRIGRLSADVGRAFLAWVERRYAGLHNQPPDPPVMVHHLPRFLARRMSDTSRCKVALVVVDGLALDQWIVLRNALTEQRPCLGFHEGAIFAWVPTVTSVSRQAIFSGTPPLYFPGSIRTTEREASLWSRFWTDNGLTAREVGYAKGLGDGRLEGVRELLSRSDIRAVGLVIDKVDRIMHGMELGTAGMHNQVRQWADEGFLVELLDELLDGGFTVFLTSDHGNIEAEGCGRPSEGAVADVRGERARVYSDPVLRDRVKEKFPDAIVWPALGLPDDWLALLAPGRSAFIREGERIVGHGGASLEEVVVPMIEVERLVP